MSSIINDGLFIYEQELRKPRTIKEPHNKVRCVPADSEKQAGADSGTKTPVANEEVLPSPQLTFDLSSAVEKIIANDPELAPIGDKGAQGVTQVDYHDLPLP